MKMEYWIMNTDHNLWKIIQNGNNKKSLGRDSKGGIIILPPVSFEEHVAVQRETKARTLALPPFRSQVALTLKTKGGLEYLIFDDLYNKLRSLEFDVKDFAVHTGNAAGSVNPAAAEFAMMGISPKVHPHVNKDIGIVDSGCSRSMTGNKEKLDDFMQVKRVTSPQHQKLMTLHHVFQVPRPMTPSLLLMLRFCQSLMLKTQVPPMVFVVVLLRKINRPASIHASRHIPASRINKPAHFPAGRSVPAGWTNPVARPFFEPTNLYFDNVHPHVNIDIGIIDSGCSRSITGNKEKLDDFVQVKGGIVTFGGGDGKITGKGTIRTSKLNFENVYYVEELQNFNLFSVSQICGDQESREPQREPFTAPHDSFADDECLVLTKEFQLPDESQVVLRIPKRHDFYTFNLSDIQPEQHINYLLAKASLEESTKWHRRMAHVNFKTINKLAKNGLVEGLPLKLFTNEHNCVACNKGKQHKASYKAISAGTKDETFYILKDFIALIENQLNKKVKVIRCDNGTEFQNAKLITLCGEKGIKRDYSNARTPQQNGFAERKNRTLIEAARSMCQVTILNISDHLGKFKGKANDCFLVGYAAHSKAYRVYNLSSKKVEETLNLRYLEDKPNVHGLGQEWYFDLDYLTDSLGYTHFKTNPPAGTHDTNIIAGPKVLDVSAPMENNLDYAEELARLQRQEHEAHSAAAKYGFEFFNATAEMLHQAKIETCRNLVLAAGDPACSMVSTGGVPAGSVPAGGVPTSSVSAGSVLASHVPASSIPAGSVLTSSVPAGNVLASHVPASSIPAGGVLAGSIDSAGFGDPAASESVPAVFTTDHAAVSPLPPVHSLGSSEHSTQFPSPSNLGNHQPTAGIFSSSSYDDDFCAGVTNLASNVAVVPVATKRVNTIHPQSQIIRELQSLQVWKLVPLPAGKIAIRTKWILKNKRDDRGIVVRNKARLVAQGHRQEEGIDYDEVYVDDIIFGFTNKAWCDEFKVLMKGEFEISAMGELTFFLGLQVKQLPDGIFISQDKSMIGSLMYLTASRPDIMFGVSACSRHQVTPMTSHLNAVKKIFKYLKGQHNLGLWYPRDSPFQLEAYSDSNYAGSYDDQKSTTGGCQFLSRRLISWQCKKQTVVATSSTEAKYVATASCCDQSTICIVKNPVFHQRTKHIEIRHHFIRDANEKNLIQSTLGCSIPRYWDWGRNKPNGRLTIVYSVYTNFCAGRPPILLVVPVFLLVVLVLADGRVSTGSCTIPTGSGTIPTGSSTIPTGSCSLPTGSYSFMLLGWFLLRKGKAGKLMSRFWTFSIGVPASVPAVPSVAAAISVPAAPSVATDVSVPAVPPDLAVDSAHVATEVHADESNPDDTTTASEHVSAEHTVAASTSSSSRTRRKHLAKKWVTPIVDIADDALIKFDSASDNDDDPLSYAPYAGWEMVPSLLGSIHAYYDMEGHTKHFTSLRELLHMVEKNDLRRLLGAVDNLYQREEPDTFALLLWGDFHVLFQSLDDEDTHDFWCNQDGWRIRSWHLYPRAQVYVLETMDGRVIYMFVDVSYPLSAATLQRMLNHGLDVPKLLVGRDLTMAEQLTGCCCSMILLSLIFLLLVHAGFFIFAAVWLFAAAWLFAAVLVCSCCWNKDAILALTSEDLSRILKLTLSNSRLGRIVGNYKINLSVVPADQILTLRGMVPKGSAIPSGVMEPLITTFVAPVSDVGPLDFVSRPNLQICPSNVRYLLLPLPLLLIAAFPGSKNRDASKDLENIADSTSAGRANADATNISKLNKPSTSVDSFYASQSLDTETMHGIYVCIGAEVKIRAKHTLERKGELEDKCAEQTVLLSERDTEISHLKSLLSLKESKAAEAIRLRGQLTTGERDIMSEKITTLESANVSKEVEFASLSSQVSKLTSDLSDLQLLRGELNSHVVSLESKRDSLISQTLFFIVFLLQKSSLESAFDLFRAHMKATQDEQAKVLGTSVAELDAQLLEMAAHLDEEFYPHFLTARSERRTDLGCVINKGIHDGLRARIDHGKAGSDLFAVEAYDPFAEAKYIEAVNALNVVDFSLLSELNSKKYACIVDLMDSLRLDGPLAEILRAEDLQPPPYQLRLPIHRPEDNIVLGETSLSFSFQVVHSRVQRSLTDEASTFAALVTAKPVTTLSITFASSDGVPPLLTSDDQASGVEPHDEEPPIVCFEKEDLVTSPELFGSLLWVFSLWSLSLYALLPKASVTSYGPSPFGLSLHPSSAWLALLFRYTRADQDQVDKLKEFLSSNFSMKDMGEADVILVSTPLDPAIKLMPNTGRAVDQLEYSRATGCLMFAMISTRPDIAYIVGKLSSWLGIFFLGGDAILRAFKKQTYIIDSTMEEKFVALAAAGKEADWLKNLINETLLWPKLISPISIHYDSAATLAMAYCQIYNRKSRH
nr:hypothetical protein [Tanacetum cinerariifolium]